MFVESKTIRERLESGYKINEKTGCWEWQRTKNHDFYGMMSVGYDYITKRSKNALVHRISFQIYKEEIGKGFIVMHTCDNPSCVNPAHLIRGTSKENTQDMIKKGRSTSLRGKKLTKEEVLRIRSLRGTRSNKKLGEDFHVSTSTISHIMTRREWKQI